jgi:hypothetical protein
VKPLQCCPISSWLPPELGMVGPSLRMVRQPLPLEKVG